MAESGCNDVLRGVTIKAEGTSSRIQVRLTLTRLERSSSEAFNCFGGRRQNFSARCSGRALDEKLTIYLT